MLYIFGDDYTYITFFMDSFTKGIKTLISHYLYVNGRLIVHFLVSIFLQLPMIFWQLFNSLMLTLICYYITKIVTKNNKEMQPLILSVTFFLIASLEIVITRQSVYWLTGSFNYIYPLMLLFIYAYTLFKIDNKNYYILSIILGFLSSATMEQSSLMTFGLTLLVLLSKFNGFKDIKKTIKSNYKLVILLIITLLGTCSVLLSPSQFIRIQSETTDKGIELSSRIVQNIKFLLTNYTCSITIYIYSLLFNILTLIYARQNETKKSKQIITVLILCCMTFWTLNLFALKCHVLIKLFLTGMILLNYVMNFIYLNKKIYNKLISPLTAALILLLGSQIMMIISPIFGLRNLIFGLIMYIFVIALVASKLELKNLSKLTPILLSVGIILNIRTSLGYLSTKEINNNNIDIIWSTPAEIILDKDNEIDLYKFPNPNYAWSLLYESDYHLKRFKEFYGINCNINWK